VVADLPPLAAALARAQVVPVADSAEARRAVGPLAARLAAPFGFDGSGGDLPLAAVTRVADGGTPDDAWWLRADPVHLEPRGGGLFLHPPGALRIDINEARALVDELLCVYAADGWRLEARHPHRWYLAPPTAARIQTTAPVVAIGRNVHGLLPTGADGSAWRTVFNEVQLVLHTSAVNRAREARGELPVNSLWFWGGGNGPRLARAHWAGVWSDEPVSRGLARLAEVSLHSLPTSAQAWLAAASMGEHWVVLGTGDVAPAHLEAEAEAEAETPILATAWEQWLRPLLAAVKSGEVACLTLYSDRGPALAVTRASLGRWWRGRRHWRRYLEQPPA
jgi:hypothetical protein